MNAHTQTLAQAEIALSPDEAQTGSAGLDKAQRQLLLKRERDIAAKYMGGRMWPYTVAAVGGFALWIAFYPLTIMGIVPLWLACIVSCVLAAGGYVTSHEAMHNNIARKGSKYHWVNELVGEVSTIILIFPFSKARLMHLEHHYHTNDPERDPDYMDEAENDFKAIIKTWINRQPGSGGSIHHYKKVLEQLGTPAAKRAQRETVLLQLGSMAFFFAMAWSGYGLVVAALWWLPRHIGLSYIRFYLSYAPHHPRVRGGRYENTVVFKSIWGHVLSMGMQTHIVHHLYPNIPNHRTKPAYFEMRDVLAARALTSVRSSRRLLH